MATAKLGRSPSTKSAGTVAASAGASGRARRTAGDTSAARAANPTRASNGARAAPSPRTQAAGRAAATRTQPARTTSAKVDPEASARETFKRLRGAYPDAHCELEHRDAFQLLVSTVLSAQSTDVAVNRCTPNLFQRWSSASQLASAELSEVEQAISSLGMFRQKAKHLVGLSKALVEEHQGEVPRQLSELVRLPGVGRKTANVVLGVAFGAPEGVVVDTHVQRLAQRLGWSKQDQPGPIEQDLMRLFPRSDWDMLSHTLIFHGRRCCTARAPACAACPIVDACPSAYRAENVGRKAKSR